MQYKVDNYDPSSGKNEEEIRSVCDGIFERKQSFGKTKSQVMAYILENCRVDICPEEFFVDKFTYFDIPKRLWHIDAPKVIKKVVSETADAKVLCDSVAIEASADFGHLAPDWQFVIGNGIPGIIERLENYKSKCDDDKTEFYDNSISVYKAILKLVE